MRISGDNYFRNTQTSPSGINNHTKAKVTETTFLPTLKRLTALLPLDWLIEISHKQKTSTGVPDEVHLHNVVE